MVSFLFIITFEQGGLGEGVYFSEKYAVDSDIGEEETETEAEAVHWVVVCKVLLGYSRFLFNLLLLLL